MLRPLLAAAALATLAAPAFADTALTADMPVVRATLAGDQIQVRLANAPVIAAAGADRRVVTVEARDANGRLLRSTAVTVSRRFSYASAPLPAGFTADAAQIRVSAR